MKNLIRRVLWMLGCWQRDGKLPRCPIKGCRGLATHTWWGYQDDDLRDIDVCRKHSNTQSDANREYLFKTGKEPPSFVFDEANRGDK